MKWFLLSQNRCPQCGADLEGDDGYEEEVRLICKKVCGFKISEQKMSEIVSNQNSRRIEGGEEKQGFDRFEL